MKYEIKIADDTIETVESDTFETQQSLLIFFNYGELPEGSKFREQLCVAAFPVDSIKSIKTLKESA